MAHLSYCILTFHAVVEQLSPLFALLTLCSNPYEAERRLVERQITQYEVLAQMQGQPAAWHYHGPSTIFKVRCECPSASLQPTCQLWELQSRKTTQHALESYGCCITALSNGATANHMSGTVSLSPPLQRQRPLRSTDLKVQTQPLSWHAPEGDHSCVSATQKKCFHVADQ